MSADQMNQLMDKISANIPNNCSAYEDIQERSNNKTPLLGSTEFSISDYEAYRNDIEFVNSFADQVLIDEEQYFVNKYSRNVYNYLLQQRMSYTAKIREKQVTDLCGSPDSLSDDDRVAQCADVCNSEEQLEKMKKCQESQNFLSYLTQQAKSTEVRPETTYKKIEYRNESHELLNTINRWMTIVYFLCLMVLFILLITSNRLNLKERFLVYLFLVLLPLIFPYAFELFKYIYLYLAKESKDHGPQNAFVEAL